MSQGLNREDSHHSHHSHHHHHSSGTEKKKRGLSFYLWVASLCLFTIALVIMIFYVTHKFIPFIRSVLYYHKLNTSTLSYIALRILMFILPAAFLCPSKLYYSKENHIDKPKVLSVILSLTALFYFIGSVADILTYNVLGGYVDTGEDPIMLKLLWNSTGLSSVAFCLVQGIAYLVLSKSIRGHKKTVFLMFFVTFALSALMPIVDNYSKNQIFTAAWYVWFYKNVYFYASELCMLLALGVSSVKRSSWSATVWN